MSDANPSPRAPRPCLSISYDGPIATAGRRPTTEFHRVGYAAMDKDYIVFFAGREPVEFTLV